MDSRESIEAEIQSQRQRRGAALLAFKKFDDAAITALNEKLAALDDADAFQRELDRQEATKKHQAEITAIRTELADLDTASIKALAKAETNLRAAVAAMKLHHTHEAAKRKAQAKLNNLTGTKEPIQSEMELHRRGSLRWMSLIKTITGNPGRYGNLEYPGMMLPDPNKSWT